MSSMNNDELLNRLESLKNEYESIYDEVNYVYTELDSVQNDAYQLMDEAANLIGSIKHVPINVSSKAKRILSEKKKISGKIEIQREERNRNIAAGAAAITSLGIGGLLMGTTFKSFFKSLAKKTGKFGVWLIAIVFFAIILICFLFWKATNRYRAKRKTVSAIKSISKEINRLKEQQTKAIQITERLMLQMAVVSHTLKRVLPYKGLSYLKIPKEDRPLLMALYNDTSALNEIMEEKI